MSSFVNFLSLTVFGQRSFKGRKQLGEVLHWQDWAAVGLMMLSIAAVLWPKRQVVN